MQPLYKLDHELLKLAKVIPWQQLEDEFKPLFSEGNSRPPLPVRLAAGLIILQHIFSISDELVVVDWVENHYWQDFCGYDFLQWELPVHPTLEKLSQKSKIKHLYTNEAFLETFSSLSALS